jgi:hypothetical protein
LVPLVVVAATVLAAIAAGALALVAVRGRGPGIADEPVEAVRAFWRLGAAAMAALAVVAIVWTGVPALLIPPCA